MQLVLIICSVILCMTNIYFGLQTGKSSSLLSCERVMFSSTDVVQDGCL